MKLYDYLFAPRRPAPWLRSWFCETLGDQWLWIVRRENLIEESSSASTSGILFNGIQRAIECAINHWIWWWFRKVIVMNIKLVNEKSTKKQWKNVHLFSYRYAPRLDQPSLSTIVDIVENNFRSVNVTNKPLYHIYRDARSGDVAMIVISVTYLVQKLLSALPKTCYDFMSSSLNLLDLRHPMRYFGQYRSNKTRDWRNVSGRSVPITQPKMALLTSDTGKLLQ